MEKAFVIVLLALYLSTTDAERALLLLLLHGMVAFVLVFGSYVLKFCCGFDGGETRIRESSAL